MPVKDYVRFNEIEDVLSSLDLLSLVAARVQEQPSYWKWVIIAAHGALQGAMVCALDDGAGVGMLDAKSARKTLEWYDTLRGTMPEGRLANFKTLLVRCQDKKRMQDEPLVLTTAQLKDICKLHEEFRNHFAHFVPMGWRIEKVGLPRIIGAAIDCIEDLMGCTQALQKLTENRKRRLLKSIKATRAILVGL